MKLRVGFELDYEFPQPTPALLVLNIHSSRSPDLLAPEYLNFNPAIPSTGYHDGYGNWCTRIMAPQGLFRISSDCVISDSGAPNVDVTEACQMPVEQLPEETLVFLLASRFCDSDQMLDLAWQLFGQRETGWARVQQICDFVHDHIVFGYSDARATRSASEAYKERKGVCRDYAHLAISFCRALNIPARYCTGYLSDVGTPLPYAMNDFAAWIEVYLGGKWHMFDPRNNSPRIGRVLVARGRDAADVAMTTTFGPNTLRGFRVWTDDLTQGSPS